MCDSVSKTPNMTKSDAIRVAAALGHIACDRIEELESELAEARAEIERKNKLIEQMREALRLALPEARSTHVEQTILAALAAERGG